LGEGEGAEDAVADVGDDFAVGVAGEGAELLPFGVGAEGAPEFFASGEVVEGEHVGEVRHARAGEGFAEKYGLHAVDPYMLSLSILIERFIFECGSAGGSVIAEARDATLNNALELAFLDLKIRGTNYVSATKVQRRIHSFTIRDKKENITGLQLADVCATPIGRHAIGRSTYPIYSDQGDFYRTIEQKLRCDSKGETGGIGLVVLPK